MGVELSHAEKCRGAGGKMLDLLRKWDKQAQARAEVISFDKGA